MRTEISQAANRVVGVLGHGRCAADGVLGAKLLVSRHLKGPMAAFQVLPAFVTTGEMLFGQFPVSRSVQFSWDYFAGQMGEYVAADPRMITSNKRIDAMRAETQSFEAFFHQKESDWNLAIAESQQATYRDSISSELLPATWRVPNWCIAIFIGVLATAPWLPWHFSVRTLLIATTLVAVVLGAIVYAIR